MVSAIEVAEGMDESVRAAVRLASKVVLKDPRALKDVYIDSSYAPSHEVGYNVPPEPLGAAALRDRLMLRLESAGLLSLVDSPEASLGLGSEESDASDGDDFERWIMILENRLTQSMRSDALLSSPWISQLAPASMEGFHVHGQLEVNLARLQSQNRGLCRNPYHSSSLLPSRIEASRMGDTVSRLLALQSKQSKAPNQEKEAREQGPLYLKDIVGPGEVDGFAASHSPVTPQQRAALCRVWELHSMNPELALVEMSIIEDPKTALLCLEFFKSLLK
jgi:hypothetical protein